MVGDASGGEGLVLLQKKDISLVLTDLKMPGMDGIEVLQRTLQFNSDIQVILMTAFDTDKTRIEAKRAGIAGYFRKPVDGQALLDTIQWVLENQPR